MSDFHFIDLELTFSKRKSRNTNNKINNYFLLLEVEVTKIFLDFTQVEFNQ
jgi:hypothetical protein